MAFISFSEIKKGGKFVYENLVWVKDIMPNALSNAHVEDPSMKSGSKYFDDAHLVQVFTEQEMKDFLKKRRIHKMEQNVKIISLDGHKKRTGVKP